MMLHRSHNRSAFTYIEKLLAMVCVSVAMASTLALFALSSSEMRGAHTEMAWRLEVERTIDRIADAVRHATRVTVPFVRSANEIRYYPVIANAESLEASQRLEGFILVDGALVHGHQVASGGPLVPSPLGEKSNPLLAGVTAFEATRILPRHLKLRLTVNPPAWRGTAGAPATFERVLCLRNP